MKVIRIAKMIDATKNITKESKTRTKSILLEKKTRNTFLRGTEREGLDKIVELCLKYNNDDDQKQVPKKFKTLSHKHLSKGNLYNHILGLKSDKNKCDKKISNKKVDSDSVVISIIPKLSSIELPIENKISELKLEGDLIRNMEIDCSSQNQTSIIDRSDLNSIEISSDRKLMISLRQNLVNNNIKRRTNYIQRKKSKSNFTVIHEKEDDDHKHNFSPQIISPIKISEEFKTDVKVSLEDKTSVKVTSESQTNGKVNIENQNTEKSNRLNSNNTNGLVTFNTPKSQKLPTFNSSKSNKLDTTIEKKLTYFDDKAPVKENTKRLSVYFNNIQPLVDKILNNKSGKTSSNDTSISNTSEIMNEQEEKFMHQKIQALRNSNFIIKQTEDDNLKDSKKEKENIKIELNKEDLNDISHKSNSKLEKRLIANISKQVVIVIMVILVGLPIIDFDFINQMLFNDQDLPERHLFCADLILYSVNISTYDKSYYSSLNKTIEECFHTRSYIDENGEISSELERFVALYYNESDIITSFQKKSNFFENDTLIKTSDYEEFLLKYRKNQDYKQYNYIVDIKNNLTFIYDVRTYGKVNSILSLLKSTYVAFLLIIGSYVFSIDVNNYVIIPLDQIFTKLNANLENLDIIEKVFQDEFLKLKEDKYKIDDIIDKNGIKCFETSFIDISLNKLLRMISAYIGKIPYFAFPNSNLDKKLKFSLKKSPIVFEGVGLFLKFSNTDEFYIKNAEQAPVIISKIISLFHNMGVAFLGDPILKENCNLIVWKKDKDRYLFNLKKYSLEIVISQSNSAKLIELLENREKKRQKEMEMENNQGVYFQEKLTDISILCGLKFLHAFLNNYKDILNLLRDNNVKMNLFSANGQFFQSLLGNKNIIQENFYGEAINEVSRILEKVEFKYLEPSLFIAESSYNKICCEIKKNIFPYELYTANSNRKTLYRHYFNYRIGENESRITLDTLNEVIEEKNVIERMLFREKDGVLNYVLKDVIYLTITSGINQTLKTLVNLIYSYYENSQYNKCLNIIDDIQNLVKINFDYDKILYSKIFDFKLNFEEISERRKSKVLLL